MVDAITYLVLGGILGLQQLWKVEEINQDWNNPTSYRLGSLDRLVTLILSPSIWVGASLSLDQCHDSVISDSVVGLLQNSLKNNNTQSQMGGALNASEGPWILIKNTQR